MKNIQLDIAQLTEHNQPRDYNQDDYSLKTDPNYLRQETINKIFDDLNNIDWKQESGYHNQYYLGEGKYGTRTLRMNNKDWHKLNNNNNHF